MKTIEYYMNLPYRLELIPDPDEGGFVALYPELPGCLTCGSTIEKAVKNAQDAKKAWLEAAIEDNISIQEPELFVSQYERVSFDIPKSLKQSLIERSREEGVSIDKYCLYLLSRNDALSV